MQSRDDNNTHLCASLSLGLAPANNKLRSSTSLPALAAKCSGGANVASCTLELTSTSTDSKNITLSISQFCIAT